MMNVNVIASLIDFLQNHDSASISGLGSFHLEPVRRKFVLDDDVIRPPRRALVYSRYETDSQIFVEFIAEKWQITTEEAERALTAFKEGIVQSIAENGTWSGQGFGTFTPEINKQLTFNPDNRNFHLKYFDLPDLTLTPVSGKGVTAFAPEVIKSSSTGYGVPPDKRKTERPWTIALVSLIVFILLLLLAMRSCDNEVNWKNQSLFGISNPGSDDTPEPAPKDEGTANGYYDSLALANPNIGNYREVLTNDILDIGCVIIVGSFQNPRNAVLMKDRIIRAGWQPYTEIYGDFTRVGILFECGEQDLVEFIKQIREQFDAKSWYLIPEFKVPFER